MSRCTGLESRSVLDQVRQLVAEQHEIPAEEVTPETHFFNNLDDSLDFVEVVMACEEAFEVDIADAEAERIETVGQLVSCIEGRLAEPR